MNIEPFNITGRRQLLLDPRIVAGQNNAMKCMSQARKLPRVIGLDEKLKGKCHIQYATVTYDSALQKVRLYYTMFDQGHKVFHALAESRDGEHFVTPPADLQQVLDEKVTPSVRITKGFADSQRMLDACQAEGPVTMDGKLSGPAWQKAPATRHFMKTGADEVSAFGTKAKVLYDDQAVYVGFDCLGKREWNQSLAKEEFDGLEHLEVIIDPTCGRKDSFYFCSSCYGKKQQDGPAAGVKHSLGKGWEEQWEVSLDRRADSWSAVFQIPFAVLGLPDGQPGCAWGFNVCHNIPAYSKDAYMRYTNWAGCWPHRVPEKMGVLVFDESEFKVKHQPVWEDVSTGRTPSAHFGDLCVFVDPKSSQTDRYKMIWREGGYLYVAVSPDGLNFKTIKSILDTGNLDSMNLAMWDHIANKYLIYTRWWFRDGPSPAQRRGVARTVSATWEGPWPDRQTVMDPRKVPGNEEGYRDFYTPGVFVYENLYLALPTVYYRNIEWGPLAPSLMVSTNGINWQWVGDGMPFIERSPGQWDQARIYAVAPPVNIGQRLYFYYTGQSGQHHVEKRDYAAESGIGAAWILLDRFLCYHGSTKWPGYVLTNPLVFEKGQQLLVNMESTSEIGELRVEVIGAPHFSADKCKPIRGDQLSAAVEWDGASIAKLRGRPLRLRFHLRGARLYAFEVK